MNITNKKEAQQRLRQYEIDMAMPKYSYRLTGYSENELTCVPRDNPNKIYTISMLNYKGFSLWITKVKRN